MQFRPVPEYERTGLTIASAVSLLAGFFGMSAFVLRNHTWMTCSILAGFGAFAYICWIGWKHRTP